MFLLKKLKWSMVIFLITMIQIDVIASSQQTAQMPCFSETVDSYLTRLETISKDYSNICAIEKKLDIKALMDTSGNLSALETYAGKPFASIPPSYTSNSTYSDPNLNSTLSQKILDLLTSWRNGVNVTSDMILELRTRLNSTIEYVATSQQYPLFFMSNLFKLSEFRRQITALRIYYNNNTNRCLPSDWRYVTTIDYNSGTNQIVVKYDPRAYFSTCDNTGNQFTLSPIDLATNGIALSMWVKEDFTLIKNDVNNLFNGIINNNVVLSYNLVKRGISSVVHQIKVVNETREIVSQASCVEWVFVLFSVQKDCDKYRLIVSLRFPGANTNSYFEFPLKASQIESMNINYNTQNGLGSFKYERYSRNFVYNFENEMVLMYIGGYPSPNEGCCAQCKPPSPVCQYYDYQGNCLICPNSPKQMYWYNYQCNENCPDGYFGHTDGKCYPCATGCKKCNGASNNQCYDCFTDKTKAIVYYLNKLTCVDKCPSDTWPLLLSNGTTVCNNCDPLCLTCSDYNKCDKCKDGYWYNSKCLLKCEPPTFAQEFDKKCIDCPTNCTACDNLDQCRGCKTGNWLKTDEISKKTYCTPNCGDGYWYNNNTYTCDRCLIGCTKCTNSKTCDKCNETMSLNLIRVSNGVDRCESTCPPGTLAIQGVCTNCAVTNCYTCPTVDTCSNCTSKDNKMLYVQNDRKCTDKCDIGSYADNEKGRCFNCTDGCDICDKYNCSTCKDGKFLFQDGKTTICRDNCPDGYSASNKKCNPCQMDPNTINDPKYKKCYDCKADRFQDCTKCYPTDYLYQSRCIDKCPPGTFADDKRECQPCPEGCEICNSTISCTDCFSNYVAMNARGGKCVPNCPSGWVQTVDSGTKVCKKCDDGCLECDPIVTSQCKRCNETLGLSLYNLKCVPGCPSGTFKNSSNMCEDCKANCANCTNRYDCNLCKNQKVLQGDECKDICDDKYVDNNKKCIKCTNPTCKRCLTTDLNTCTECDKGSFLYNNNCTLTCDNGRYSEDNVTCKDCLSPCKNCKSAKECIDCVSGFSLTKNKTCTDNCGDHYVALNGNCEECLDKNCLKCNSTQKANCMRCNYTHVLMNGDCIPYCPPGHFNQSGECVKCADSHCTNCTSTIDCIWCDGTYKLLNKKSCVDKCNDGMIDINGICVDCKKESNCKTCKKEDTTKCDTCPLGKKLQFGVCQDNCNSGYWADENNVCQKCDTARCAKCENNGKTCKVCENPALLRDQTCVDSCGDGYVKIDDYNCKKCIDRCKDCPPSATDTCILCQEGSYLPYGRTDVCNENCQSTYYKNNVKRTCEPCSTNCTSCIDADTCTQCQAGSYLYNKKCVPNCPEGYFNNPKGYCERCTDADLCLNCDVNRPETCYKCKNPPGILFNKTCLNTTTCPREYFDNGKGECIKCGSDCDSCKDQLTCYNCTFPKILGQDGKCGDSCPTKSVERDRKCIPCTESSTHCEKCNSTNTDQCTQCEKGYYINSKGNCVRDCGDEWYHDDIQCKPCTANCKLCKSSDLCDECKDNFFRHNQGKICIPPECPQYFVGLNKECVPCTTACLKCDKDKCLTCDSTAWLQEGTCKPDCTNGFYREVSSKTCQKCSEYCLSCEGKDKCKTCDEKHVLKNGYCVDVCGPQYTQLADTRVCKECDTTFCAECQRTDSRVCTKCLNNYVLYNNTCIASCPAGTFNNSNICDKCLDHCDSCKNKTICEQCSQGFSMKNTSDECVNKCPEGQYSENQRCQNCNVKECGNCDPNKLLCEKCKLPLFYVMYNNSCDSICPMGTYIDDRNCRNCTAECEDCITKDVCKTCRTGYFLLNSTCRPQCEEGFVGINKVCVKCNTTDCKVCSPDPTKCNECKNGKYLHNVNNTCLDDCPEYFYKNGKECSKCGSNCKKCTNQNQCDVCESGFVLENGVCKTYCKPGMVPVDSKCKDCIPPNCNLCNSQDVRQCITCMPGYVLSGGECKQVCDELFFRFNVSLGREECRPCGDKCKRCVDQDTCIECVDGMYLQNGKCVNECGKGFVETSNKRCYNCTDPLCEKCEANNLDSCIACKDPHFLYKGQCGKCPIRTMETPDRKCKDCKDDKCLICNPDEFTCKNCTYPYIAHEGKCILNCPERYSKVNGECKPCGQKECLKCGSDLNICEKCDEPLILDNNFKCVPKCPKGMAEHNNKCENCQANCEDCSTIYTCNNCTAPFELSSNRKCVDKCNQRGMVLLSNGTCAKCEDQRCDVCDQDLKTCKECTSGMVLQNGTCVPVCTLPGYFTDREAKRCQPCSSNCATCTGSPKPCQSCQAGYVLSGDECVRECPSGYMNVSNVCYACPENCQECDPKKPGECSKCIYPFYREGTKCVRPCSKNKVLVNDTCVDCRGNCSICHLSGTCDDCLPGFFKYQGGCVDKCPDGTAYLNGECLKCTDDYCKTCSGEILDRCIVCNSTRPYIFNYKCNEKCPDDTFMDDNKNCYKCEDDCAKCTGPRNCTLCKLPKILTKTDDGSTICGDGVVCPSGYYVGSDNKCIACPDTNCRKCRATNPSECTLCKSEYSLFNKQCVKPCPEGFYSDGRNCTPCTDGNCKNCTAYQCFDCKANHYFSEVSGLCINCDSPKSVIVNNTCAQCRVEGCLKCEDGNPWKCKICSEPKNLVNGFCSDTCPDGTYRTSTGCKNCTSPCATCSNPNTCNSCPEGFFFYEGACRNNCTQGYMPSPDRKCVKCETNCVMCNATNTGQCFQCETGFFLVDNKCLKYCLDGTYNDNGKCTPCPQNCTRCDGANMCTDCINGFKKQDGKCVQDCAQGYYYHQFSNNCYKCDDNNCAACSPRNVCKKCNPPFHLNPKTDNCDQTCPSKYFLNEATNTCEPCSKECGSCVNNSTCTSCDEGYYWYNNTCTSTCPPKHNTLKGNCVPCSSKDCLYCRPERPDICDVCNATTTLYRGNCLPKCPDNTMTKYLDPTTVACYDCDERCRTCNERGCINCIEGFQLINGTCVNLCPDGSTRYNGQCSKCDVENCTSCKPGEQNRCIECAPGFILEDGSCVRTCKEGFYPDGKKCSKCMDGCKSCKTAERCDICFTNLFNGICIDKCPLKTFSKCNIYNSCEKCINGCRRCDNEQTCQDCDDGFIRLKHYCILPNDCPVGRFVDKKTNVCKRCKVPFCASCSDSSTCTSCKNGYNLSGGSCLESKYFTSVFTNPILLDEFVYNNINSSRSIPINSVNFFGIGSSELAVSFWIRLITPPLSNLTESKLFEIRVPKSDYSSSTYSYTSQNTFSINFGLYRLATGELKCSSKIITPTDKSVRVFGEEINFHTNREWRLFIVQFKKSNNNFGRIHIRTFDPVSNKINHYDDTIPQELNFDLISKDSILYLNEDARVNPAFELSNMNLFDYLPTESDIANLYNSKPADCDYMCNNCLGQCRSCSNGDLLTNGKCPAAFVSVVKQLVQVSSPFTRNLRILNVNKRLSSDTYAIVGLFYFTSLDNTKNIQLANLSHRSSSGSFNVLDVTVNKGYISVGQGRNPPKVLDSSTNSAALKAKTWYYINVSVQPGATTVDVIEYGVGFVINNVMVNNSTRIFRITEDAEFSLGTNPKADGVIPFSGSIFDVRLYLQNTVPVESLSKHIQGLGCDANCDGSCNELVVCQKCKDNFLPNTSGGCSAISNVRGAILLDSKYESIYNTPEKTFYTTVSQDFSFFVWFRKKFHSFVSIKPTFNLILLNDKPVLTETVNVNYTSTYTLRSPFDSSTKSADINNGDIIPEWYQFFFIKSGSTFTIQVVDIKNNTLEMKSMPYTSNGNSTIKLTLGDSSADQANSEFIYLTAFNETLQNTSVFRGPPKDCDSSCKQCDYQTGMCSICKADNKPAFYCLPSSQTLRKCIFSSFEDANRTLSTQTVFNPMYNIRVVDDYKADVNSNAYSFYGWFSLFNKYSAFTGANLSEKKVLLFRISNNDNVDRYYNIYTPSRNLISFELRFEVVGTVTNPYYCFVISELYQNRVIRVNGVTPRENEFILIHAGVDVSNKSFGYSIYSMIDGKEYANTVNLNNYPERLQTSGTLKFLGVNSILDNNYIFSNGYFYNSSLIVNAGYNSTLVNSTFLISNPYNDKTPCSSNCQKCVIGVCLKCESNCDMSDNQCKKRLTVNYVTLTDQTFASPIDSLGNSQSSYSVKIPSTACTQNHGFQVFFRRNYVPAIYDNIADISTRKIIHYGLTDVYLIATQTQAYIKVVNQKNGISVKLAEFDKGDAEYAWYALLFYVDYAGSNLVVTLQSSNNVVVDTQKLQYEPNGFDSIDFNTLNYEVTMVQATLIYDITSLSKAIFNFPTIDCPIDCTHCQNNVCLVCDYGAGSEQNTCVKKQIRANNIVISDRNKDSSSFSLSETLKDARVPRFKDFTISFRAFNIGSTVFRIMNNNDMTLSRYNSDSINYNIISISRTDENSNFVLTYSTRNTGSSAQSTFKLPLSSNKMADGDNLFFAVSVNHATHLIGVVIYQNNMNYLSVDIPFQGTFDYLGLQTYVTFGDFTLSNVNAKYLNAPMTVTDITFYYERPFPAPELLSRVVEPLSNRVGQKACKRYTNGVCTVCDNNIVPENGLCRANVSTDPNNTPFDLWTRSSIQSMRSTSAQVYTFDKQVRGSTFKTFSFRFSYRRISYPENDVIGVLSLFSLDSSQNRNTNALINIYERQNALYFQNTINPTFPIEGVIENLYPENNRFAWLDVFINCVLAEEHKCFMNIFNYSTKTSVTRSYSAIGSSSAQYQFVEGVTLNVKLPIDNNAPFNMKIAPVGVVGLNTEFELANLRFIPLDQWNEMDLPRTRMPAPDLCDRNCACQCEKSKCPDVCILKKVVINIQDASVPMPMDSTSGTFGISSGTFSSTSTTTTNPSKPLFRPVGQYLSQASSLQPGQVPPPSLGSVALTFARYQLHVDLNIQQYTMWLNTATTSTTPTSTTTTSGTTTTYPKLPLLRFSERQTQTTSTATTSSTTSPVPPPPITTTYPTYTLPAGTSTSSTTSSSTTSTSSSSTPYINTSGSTFTVPPSSTSTTTSSTASVSSSTTKVNGDILLILSNQDEAKPLYEGLPIPASVADRSIITVRIRSPNILSILVSNPQNTKDVVLPAPISSLTKLNLFLYMDTQSNFMKITVFADDLRLDVSFNFNYSAEAINQTTMVYTNPGVTASNLIITGARIDWAINSIMRGRSVPSNLCDRSNCSRCISSATGISCHVCTLNNVLLNHMCIPRQNTISAKKRRVSTLKSRKTAPKRK